MRYKHIEEWLLKRGFFVKKCKECGIRKKGCYKDCKYVKAYEERSRR